VRSVVSSVLLSGPYCFAHAGAAAARLLEDAQRACDDGDYEVAREYVESARVA
jgi:hypothetical protein